MTSMPREIRPPEYVMQIGYANGWYVWDGRSNLSEGCSTREIAIRKALQTLDGIIREQESYSRVGP